MAEKDDTITEDEPTLRSKAPKPEPFVRPFIQARHFSRGRAMGTRLIVVHTAECHEVKGAARNIATWFAGPQAPQASAHYCVDDREVVGCVLESDVAWHAGPVNPFSLGIELSGAAAQGPQEWGDEYSTRVLANAAALVAELCAIHDIPIRKLGPDQVKTESGICGHVDVTKGTRSGTHWDPGEFFPWTLFLDMIRAASEAL